MLITFLLNFLKFLYEYKTPMSCIYDAKISRIHHACQITNIVIINL